MSETEIETQGQKPKTSKLAIASILIPMITTSVVLCFMIGFIEAGGFWLTLVDNSPFAAMASWPVGLILGIVALVVVKKSNGLLKGRGFAIAGIVLSSFFIFAALTLLVAVLDYATADEVHRVICGTNLSGLGKAILIYENDNDDKHPTPGQWCDLLVKYVEVTEKEFVCPSAGEGRCHYAINPNCEPNSPPDMVLVFETKGGWNQFGGQELLTAENHQGVGCNVLFNDSHVEFVTPEKLAELKWKDEQKQ